MKKSLFVIIFVISTFIFNFNVLSNSQTFLNDGEVVELIEMGGYHSGALTSEGRVFTWGGNDRGQLGDNTTVSKSTPVDITSRFSLNIGEKVVSLSFGARHSLALTSE